MSKRRRFSSSEVYLMEEEGSMEDRGCVCSLINKETNLTKSGILKES